MRCMYLIRESLILNPLLEDADVYPTAHTETGRTPQVSGGIAIKRRADSLI